MGGLDFLPYDAKRLAAFTGEDKADKKKGKGKGGDKKGEEKKGKE